MKNAQKCLCAGLWKFERLTWLKGLKHTRWSARICSPACHIWTIDLTEGIKTQPRLLPSPRPSRTIWTIDLTEGIKTRLYTIPTPYPCIKIWTIDLTEGIKTKSKPCAYAPFLKAIWTIDLTEGIKTGIISPPRARLSSNKFERLTWLKGLKPGTGTMDGFWNATNLNDWPDWRD